MTTFLYIYLIGYITNFLLTLKMLSEIGGTTKDDLWFCFKISFGSWIALIALFSYLDDKNKKQ